MGLCSQRQERTDIWGGSCWSWPWSSTTRGVLSPFPDEVQVPGDWEELGSHIPSFAFPLTNQDSRGGLLSARLAAEVWRCPRIPNRPTAAQCPREQNLEMGHTFTRQIRKQTQVSEGIVSP